MTEEFQEETQTDLVQQTAERYRQEAYAKAYGEAAVRCEDVERWLGKELAQALGLRVYGPVGEDGACAVGISYRGYGWRVFLIPKTNGGHVVDIYRTTQPYGGTFQRLAAIRASTPGALCAELEADALKRAMEERRS